MHISLRLLFPKICSMLTIKTADKTNDFNPVSLFLTLKKISHHLQSKSLDWFLCDRDLHHERINQFRANFPIYLNAFKYFAPNSKEC